MIELLRNEGLAKVWYYPFSVKILISPFPQKIQNISGLFYCMMRNIIRGTPFYFPGGGGGGGQAWKLGSVKKKKSPPKAAKFFFFTPQMDDIFFLAEVFFFFFF